MTYDAHKKIFNWQRFTQKKQLLLWLKKVRLLETRFSTTTEFKDADFAALTQLIYTCQLATKPKDEEPKGY